MEAVVLAGGRGTRLGDMTRDLPKPMMPVRGRPFLEHVLDYWQRQGATRFILSTGYRAQAIEDYFGTNFAGTPVTYCREETPLGTGGALLLASRLVEEESFLALNGDTFFEVSLHDLSSFHRKNGAAATLALFQPQTMNRYEGVRLDAEGRIAAFVPRGAGETLPANGGIYVMEKKLTEACAFGQPPVSLESGLFPQWLREKRKLCGLVFGGKFIDIGIPEDYERAGTMLPA